MSEHTCENCFWFACDPMPVDSRGVCFRKWVDTFAIENEQGAYEVVFKWQACDEWEATE